jgi:uncharacterized protein YgiM (DUF1202 family)
MLTDKQYDCENKIGCAHMEKCRKIGIAGIPAPEAGRRWKTRILADGLMPLLAISLVTILLAFMASAALASGVDYQYAQVTTPKGPLNMRKTASSKASIIEKIPNDTILAVSVVDDIWCKCTYHGKEGYVMTKYLSIMDISQFRSLSLYDSGQDVSLLKEKLQELYYFDTEADISDSYDSDTEATVKLFQAANGMEETGIASPELQAFVYWGDPKNNLPTKPMTVEISSRCSGYKHVGQNWSRYSSINGKAYLQVMFWILYWTKVLLSTQR